MYRHRRSTAVTLALVAIACTFGVVALAQRTTGSAVRMPKYDEVADIADLPMLGRWRINVGGRVFTSQSWSPTNPNPQGMSNLMYFERQDGPVAPN